MNFIQRDSYDTTQTVYVFVRNIFLGSKHPCVFSQHIVSATPLIDFTYFEDYISRVKVSYMHVVSFENLSAGKHTVTTRLCVMHRTRPFSRAGA